MPSFPVIQTTLQQVLPNLPSISDSVHRTTNLRKLLIQDRWTKFGDQDEKEEYSPSHSKLLSLIAPDFYHRNHPQYHPTSLDTDNHHKNNHEKHQEDNDRQQISNKQTIQSSSPPPPSPLWEESSGDHPYKDDDGNEKHHHAQFTNHEDDNNNNHDILAQKLIVIHQHDHRTLQIQQPSVIHNTCPSNLSNDDNDITLVIQTTLDRLPLLQWTCQHWSPGPIILVLYQPPPTTPQKQQQQQQQPTKTQWNNTITKIMKWSQTKCTNIQKWIHYDPIEKNQHHHQYYPVNVLRNIGLDHVQTSHVLVLDVDFIPSLDLYSLLQNVLSASSSSSSHDKRAIVVPAFERLRSPPCQTMEECLDYLNQKKKKEEEEEDFFLPRTFEALRSCILRHECIVFQSDVNWEGHSTTRSGPWLAGHWYEDDDDTTTTSLNEVDVHKSMKSIHCFDSLRYEPYVVLPWCPTTKQQQQQQQQQSSSSLQSAASTTTTTTAAVNTPYYDERFHGYGKNKIQHISHLRFMGYKFSILPRGFIVHSPHPESNSKQIWNNNVDVDGSNNKLHQTMDRLYVLFLNELAERFENNGRNNNIMKQCPLPDRKKKKERKKRKETR